MTKCSGNDWFTYKKCFYKIASQDQQPQVEQAGRPTTSLEHYFHKIP